MNVFFIWSISIFQFNADEIFSLKLLLYINQWDKMIIYMFGILSNINLGGCWLSAVSYKLLKPRNNLILWPFS